MAAVASPALRLRPRAAYPSAPASSACPRCRFGSLAYSCSKAIPPLLLKHLEIIPPDCCLFGIVVCLAGNSLGFSLVISFGARS